MAQSRADRLVAAKDTDFDVTAESVPQIVSMAARLEERLRVAERDATDSRSLLQALQSTAPIGFGFVDRDFRQLRVNDVLAATTGLWDGESLDCTAAEGGPKLWSDLEPICRRVLETGETVVNRETSGAFADNLGHEHTWLTSFYPVRVGDEVIGVGLVTVDITERKLNELKLGHLTEQDPLTGIYNRGKLFSELERTLTYAARYQRTGAVLVVDVDNFKWTNNTYGHAAGDHLLASVAQILLGRLRETDIAARVGADEFVVVLPEATEEQAFRVALELRALLCERPTGPPVHVSIGVALFDGSEQVSADDILVAADTAMYQVKVAGGDQAAIYKGQLGRLTERVRGIRQALTDRRFVLHAQPILDLRSGEVAAHELLIRMVSEAGQIIEPAEFLPVAERLSLVTEIDRWVIEEAIAMARQMPVTVNLSARSIGDTRILDTVRDAIAAGIDPRHLAFEITETAVMTDFDRALAFVSALAELGCELALDDFGTGFGSFTYLKHLPARYLKIDMEFVRGVTTDATDLEIVRSIVGIAHSLGKETIAEGVESADVLKVLDELGVDCAQGFYIGAPESLVERLERREHAA